ncbi:MAG: chromosomal replication initiator protein DnaA [Pseudomonadota bacterium]|nr:chromosomal replication initiator protein DnaA [Pseudomonadota bacterium]
MQDDGATAVNDETGNKKELARKWGLVRTALRSQFGEDVFSSWFARIELESADGEQLQLSVPTRFLKSWLQSHYLEKLLDCCATQFKGVTSLDIRVRRPQAPGEISAPAAEPAVDARALPSSPLPGIAATPLEPITLAAGLPASPLDPRFTFDSFLVGTSNRLVHAAATEVAEATAQGPLRYNPLYIHSNVGLGKTHLLNAIAWRVRELGPTRRILYLTAENFMTKFVNALRNKDAVAFKENLRCIDILLIDDMEFLQGPTLQQEFCHALNSLIDGGKQVVVAADRAPAQLERLDTRMRSRLAGGLVAEIAPMEIDLRRRILERRAGDESARDSGFIVPSQVIELLAERLRDGGRELEGAINRLRAAHLLAEQPITVDGAEHIVRDLMQGGEPRRVKIDDIVRTVTKHYGVNRSDLLSSRRNRSIVRPRQIGMYLAKMLTSRSLPEIGRRFGNRDHTTVLHAIRKIEQLMQADRVLKEEIELLRRLIRE